MRGRKIDGDFICEFVKKCAENNLSTPPEIVFQAKLEISNIDKLLLKIEKLKIKRKKLLDVILSFEEQTKNISNSDINIINFSKLTNYNLCSYVASSLKEDININKLYNSSYDKKEIIFCIKQLIENKIITKNNSILSRGENYDNYISYLSRNR
jgi:hypothetical protein